MGAASCSEVVACLIRVPTEVMKQRYQANQLKQGASLAGNITELINKEGIFGFYRGFGSTILREIPFSLIQFPLYEALKVTMIDYSSLLLISYHPLQLENIIEKYIWRERSSSI